MSQHRRSLRPTAYSAAPTLAELGAAQVGPLTAFHRAEAELLRSRISFFLSYGSDAPPQMLKAAAQLMPLDPARARETYLEALIAALLTRRAGHQGGATLSSGHMVRRGERGGSACVAGLVLCFAGLGPAAAKARRLWDYAAVISA